MFACLPRGQRLLQSILPQSRLFSGHQTCHKLYLPHTSLCNDTGEPSSILPDWIEACSSSSPRTARPHQPGHDCCKILCCPEPAADFTRPVLSSTCPTSSLCRAILVITDDLKGEGIYLTSSGEPKSGTTWLGRLVVGLCLHLCGNQENTWWVIGE